MRLRGIAAMAVLLAFLAPQAAATAADSTVTVMQGTQLRTARLHVPSGLPSDPSLVVVLHGGTGSAQQAETSYHMDTAADADHFVVTYPAGIGASWNAGDCCGAARSSGTNDVAFLDALVAKLRSTGPLSASSKVYVTGISNGAMMAYRWACEGATAVAGLGIVAGSRQVDPCPHPTTRRVIAIHGSADGNIPEDGDPAKVDRSKKLSLAATHSVDESLAPFLSAGGCSAGPTQATFGAVVRTTWSPCSTGALVEKLVVQGGGHSWPCAAPLSAAAATVYDQPSQAMSATLTLIQEWGLAGEPVPCTGT